MTTLNFSKYVQRISYVFLFSTADLLFIKSLLHLLPDPAISVYYLVADNYLKVWS